MKQKLTLLLLALFTTVGAWATDVVISDRTNTVATGDVTTTNEHKYGTYSNAAGGTTFTTNATSGMAGVTVTADAAMIRAAYFSGANYLYVMGFNPSDDNAHTITISAPEGYLVTGYSITAISTSSSRTFTVTPTGDTSNNVTAPGLTTINKTGLSNQTATITIKAANSNTGNFLCFPLFSVTVMSASAQTVNVTYELWDNGGSSAISSETKVQEANSAISAPASWTSSPIYSYTIQGTIGDSDCTIKVIRTKIGVETTADLSNSKCYTIRTYDRGWWVVVANATQVTSTTNAGLATAASDTKQRFAFITYDDTDDANDGIYLYSVSEKKFISKSGSYTILSTPGDKVTLPASSGDNNYPTVIALNGVHAGISNGYNPAVITSWQSLSDGGNRCAIVEAADFDATEALAALNEYFHPSYTVTYIVKNGSNNVLFTSEPVATTNGATITTLPAEYQRPAFYTYNTVNVTISTSGNTNVEFTATPKDDAPVRYTADTSNPYYYNLNIRSKYLVYNTSATGEVTLQDTSEPFNSYASWAFIGEPYAGFKVINKEKGTDYFLTYTTIVTGSNGGGDGSNNNVRFVASSDFNNRYWIIETNTNGFCMRMKENTNIYFHHQSIVNSNGYLRTCSVTEWSAVHNDAGSTIVASTDEDVLIALYNSMKDYTYGTAIGQYSAEGVTAADANATISSVGTAITNNMTSAYADAYAALNALQAKTSLNSPAAGFYRVKNVATNGYLYATAASGYTSTDRYVYANGNNSSAETIIQLAEHNGHLYMLTQGHEFGWVAESSTGSGQVGYVKTSNIDKYVNWLPGTAAGQIAFAICFGNGTGNYASYLTQGIYAVDTQDNTVIRGTDYTENAAQWIFEPVTNMSITLNGPVGGSYYATFCVPFDVTLDGATAYTLSLNADQSGLTLSEGTTTVAAGTPVLLKGTSASATATISTAESSAISTETALTGTYFAKSVTGGTDYFLGNVDGKVGFYHWDGSTLKANRAYLEASKLNNSGVKGFALDFEDDATGINNVNANLNLDEAIYNLAGQRLNKMQKGINIINGKKILK